MAGSFNSHEDEETTLAAFGGHWVHALVLHQGIWYGVLLFG